MPRISRKNINTNYVHAMIQGIERKKIFLSNKSKEKYLELIERAKEEMDIKVLVYAIMDNHAHMLIYYEDVKDLSKFMNKVNTSYALYYNRRMDRVGYVYRDRYKTQQITDEKHLYNVIAYIHRNPVKAGIVKECKDYKFSSYNKFIRNKVDKEDIKLLFQSEDYKEVFQYIHKNYNEENMLEIEEKEYKEKVLEEIMDNQSINKLKELKKNKDMLIYTIKEIKERCNISDKEIAEFLEIGKNRIYQLVNKK